MNKPRTVAFTQSMQGQILRRSERREVAIFLRDRTLWVADFIDGEGELVDAPTWFRFNCGELSTPHARRRMVLESAIPMSEDLVRKIERLALPVAGSSRGIVIRLAEAIAAYLPPSPFAAKVAARMRRGRGQIVESPD
jgi:hypothetical protein